MRSALCVVSHYRRKAGVLGAMKRLHCPHRRHRPHFPLQGFSVAEFLEAIQEAVDRKAKKQ